jgi:N-acetylneuraminic acid mutarotase
VLGAKIYLAGGVIPDPENPRGARVRDFSVYDTETNEWEELPPMVEESAYFGAAISLGYLFTFGGSTVAEVPRPGRTFAYDLEVEEWVEGAVVPVPVSSFAVAHHRGRIYLFGGIAGATGRINHETQVYDVRTDEWSTTTSMPTPRFAMAAGVIDGRIYVPGGVQQTGENDFEAVPLVEVLGP